jgi:drug/metabolite transporter (DMT)-like permease
MCRNWKLWAAIAVVVAGVALFAPGGFGAVAPVLLVAACPLAMVLMGVGMIGGGRLVGRGGDDPDRDTDEVREPRAEAGERTATR